jgi:SAM-dependent methyltransferase
LKGCGQEHEPSLWWRISDRDSFAIIQELFSDRESISVLEPACGSGGTSILLDRFIPLEKLCLLDASSNALEFARTLVPEHLRDRVECFQGDAFELPFATASFDLCWNVGVIEHYPAPLLLDIVREMLRVTKPDGRVVVGIPNRHSIATLKALLLGTSFARRQLEFIPGYRFDTERLYGNRDLARIFRDGLCAEVEIRFGGNALWVGAPEPLVALTDKMMPRSCFSFLSFFILRNYADCRAQTTV